ncbi:CNNM domain-containing protein [Thalassotalea litorea]|uniref:CNNM domain-containing protein n=1 Tax=Thalassotalea litorea TaxID=2020715 RepID=UPI00373553DC
MTLLIVYLCIAIGVSFLCSILEAVLLSITPSYVAEIEQNKSRGYQQLTQAKQNLDQSISSILILNTFAHTMGAAGVGSQALQVFGEKWETLVAFLLTLAILYFSEIIPKTIGAHYWRTLAIPSAFMINFLVKLVYPLVWISGFLTRIFSGAEQPSISREELLAITTLGQKGGAIANQESLLVQNILKLREAKTEDILTPRSVVHALSEESTVAEALAAEQTVYFTRIPIYDGSVDNITGLIIKNHLYESERQGKADVPLKDLALPIHRISESFPVLNLLDVFIKRKEHLFLVEDHFGQTAGIVTLEDTIETILGREIVDESDSVEDLQLYAKANYRTRLKAKFNKVNESGTDKKD